MKFQWSKDHKSVVLIAKTASEVDRAELFVDGMNYARYAMTYKHTKASLESGDATKGRIVGAKFNVIPDEPEKTNVD